MSTSPGWYPDPADPSSHRWWDGSSWSAQTRPVAQAAYPSMPPAAYPSVATQPRVSVDTNTVWIWLAIIASALPLLTLFFFDTQGYAYAMSRAEFDPSAAAAATTAWLVQSVMVSLVSWGLMGVSILFCWLDWRELRRRGVPQPFHWAWAFFALLSTGIAVYMIGRAVVLRRRTVAAGWAPLWAWVGVTVVGFIIAMVWMFTVIGSVLDQLAGISA